MVTRSAARRASQDHQSSVRASRKQTRERKQEAAIVGASRVTPSFSESASAAPPKVPFWAHTHVDPSHEPRLAGGLIFCSVRGAYSCGYRSTPLARQCVRGEPSAGSQHRLGIFRRGMLPRYINEWPDGHDDPERNVFPLRLRFGGGWELSTSASASASGPSTGAEGGCTEGQSG